MNINQKFLFALILLICLINNGSCLSCKNLQNDDEEYFSIIKYPGYQQLQYKYSYYDIESGKFSQQTNTVDDEGSALVYTLNQINSKFDLIAWNDELPDGSTKTSGAHAKGLLAYDPKSDTGFILTHSVPKYPDISDSGKINYQINDAQNIYGQSFICLSMDGSNLEKLGQGLLIEKLNVYHSKFSTSKYSNLNELANGKSSRFLELYLTASNTQTLTIDYNVNGNYKFKSFFKNPSYQVDMFKDIMAPQLKTNLLVESWGRPYLPSDCSGQYAIKNIVDINDENSKWKDTNDHSKWAIGEQPSWACLGEMNHMTSQSKRGGSFHCTQDKKLWNALKNVIAKVDEC